MSEMMVEPNESVLSAQNLRASQAVDKSISISSDSGKQPQKCSGEDNYHDVEFRSGRESDYRKWYPEALLDLAV
jgi:hypothetical protein